MSLLDGLVSYWKLDETSGTRFDSHGSNDLTDNNTVGFAAGKQGNAADFTATNSEWLSVADNASLSPGNTDFTFAAWVQLESDPAGDTSIVGKLEPGGNQREYYLEYLGGATDRFRFQASGDGVNATVVAANNFGAASVGVWYFVVAWHDSVANTVNIQVNNGTPDSAAHTTGIFNGTGPFNIGARGTPTGTLFWDGLIDEVGYWSRVLTPAERTQLYNAGAGMTYPFGGGRRGSRNSGLPLPIPI